MAKALELGIPGFHVSADPNFLICTNRNISSISCSLPRELFYLESVSLPLSSWKYLLLKIDFSPISTFSHGLQITLTRL